MDDLIDVVALWQVLIASLVAGVGVAVVFALGLVGLSRYEGWTDGGRTSTAQRAAGLGVAAICFAAVVVGVGLGIATIVAG